MRKESSATYEAHDPYDYILSTQDGHIKNAARFRAANHRQCTPATAAARPQIVQVSATTTDHLCSSATLTMMAENFQMLITGLDEQW
jgi:hypothetical protein